MAEAYIVGAVRTAAGRKRGRLAKQHPIDLGAEILDELLRRTQADPALIEDVIFGCVNQVGSQGTNIARNAILSSGMPGVRSRNNHRPPMRIFAAGAPLRRPGRSLRCARCRNRRRRRDHEPRTDRRQCDRRPQARLRQSLRKRNEAPLPRREVQSVRGG